MYNKIVLLLSTILLFPLRFFTKVSPFALIRTSLIDKTSAISSGCKIYNCQIGKYTYLGKKTIAINTEIGNFCSISHECIINPGSHPMNMISTSPVFYSNNNILKKSFSQKRFEEFEKVKIGSDVWIGARTFIKGGVTIGDGAIIGAYSIVTKDVEPFTIVAGNPARVIRKRFDEETATRLSQIEWWKWDDKKIEQNASLFSSPSDFINNNF